MQLLEGESYIARLTVINQSTKAGVPVAATLTINITAMVNSQVIMEDSEVYGFAAEETHAFEFFLAVPMGTEGKTGAVVAEALDPNGNKLADGSLDIEIGTIVPPFDPWVYDLNGDGVIDGDEYIQAVIDSYDGIITEEQAEQVYALQPPRAFTFSDVSAEMVDCIAAPAFKSMNFDCLITNPTDLTIVKGVKLMHSYYVDSEPGVVQGIGVAVNLGRILVRPGSPYHYHFEGNYYSTTPWPGWYTYVLIHRRQTHCLWLEDDTGIKSEEACVHWA